MIVCKKLEPQTNNILIIQPQNVGGVTSQKPINSSLVNPGMDQAI